MWTQRVMWIVWPAFLSACILELVVFAFVDPLELRWSGQDLAWPRQAVYSGAFFLFWVVGLVSGTLTSLLKSPVAGSGECPLPVGERPEGCPQR